MLRGILPTPAGIDPTTYIAKGIEKGVSKTYQQFVTDMITTYTDGRDSTAVAAGGAVAVRA